MDLCKTSVSYLKRIRKVTNTSFSFIFRIARLATHRNATKVDTVHAEMQCPGRVTVQARTV